MRGEYTRTIEPARALAAEALTLERTLGDLVNQAYGLTPAGIALMWQTAPPRMPIPPPEIRSSFGRTYPIEGNRPRGRKQPLPKHLPAFGTPAGNPPRRDPYARYTSRRHPEQWR